MDVKLFTISLCVLVFVCTSSGHNNFQVNYCNKWSCLQDSLGLTRPDDSKHIDVIKLEGLLVIDDEWRTIRNNAFNKCIKNANVISSMCILKQYITCFVKELIQHCPEAHKEKDKSCTHLLPGRWNDNHTLFYQNTVVFKEDLNSIRSSLHKIHQSSNCCKIPNLFEESVLNKCGVDSIIKYETSLYKPMGKHSPFNPITDSWKDLGPPFMSGLSPPELGFDFPPPLRPPFELGHHPPPPPPFGFGHHPPPPPPFGFGQHPPPPPPFGFGHHPPPPAPFGLGHHPPPPPFKWSHDESLRNFHVPPPFVLEPMNFPVEGFHLQQLPESVHHFHVQYGMNPTDVPNLPSPLECVNLTGLISNSELEECDFNLKWVNSFKRLELVEPIKREGGENDQTKDDNLSVRRDFKVLPMPCASEKCIFSHLNVTLHNGEVNKTAYMNFLDSIVEEHPMWGPAKELVEERCFSLDAGYDDEHCMINRILACTFDVMTENCPSSRYDDNHECTGNNMEKSNKTQILCQISSSKKRPMNRRKLCPLPPFVETSLLNKCDVPSISRLQLVVENDLTSTVKVVDNIQKSKFYNRIRGMLPFCAPLNNATTCVMRKRNVISKYGYLDYIKMRKLIDKLPMKQTIMDAFDHSVHYMRYCMSQRKILNVIDSYIMNTPWKDWNQSTKCQSLHRYIHSTPKSFILRSG